MTDNDGKAAIEKAVVVDGRPLATVEPAHATPVRRILLNLLTDTSGIPERFTRKREDFLRSVGLDVDIVADAITIVCQKIGSLSFVVTGPEQAATEWRDILVRFWTTEVQSFVRELCWSNKGAYSQIVRWAPPWAVDDDGLMTERGREAEADGTADNWEVAFVMALDSRRCTPQGDLQVPLVYSPTRGDQVKLRETQFLHVIDSPIADPENPGLGQCAVDRCIKKALERREIVNYFLEAFSDKPRAGLVALNNIHKDDYQEALNVLATGQKKKGMASYRGMILLTSAEVTQPIGVQTIPFRIAPEGWDQRNTYEETVQIVATSFGLDTLEFGILPTAGLGSATQSTVMHTKSRGKFVGLIIEGLEREIKLKLLPDDVGFEFMKQDVEEDREKAEVQNVQIGNVREMWEADASGAGMITLDESRQLLANLGSIPKEFVDGMAGREEIEETEPTTEKRVKAYSGGRVEAVALPLVLRASALKQTSPSSVHPRKARQAVEGYQAELRTIYDDWAEEAAADLGETDEDDREALLAGLFLLLAMRLKAAGRRGLTDAFELGLGGEIPDAETLAILDEAVAANDRYVEGYVRDAQSRFAQDSDVEGFPWDDVSLTAALAALAWRTALYGGIYWAMMGRGIGVGVVKRGNPVFRYLDPLAKHCNTCPPKEGRYDNWDAMVADNGGVPGDGSDECGPGCRCGVKERIDGNWVVIW